MKDSNKRRNSRQNLKKLILIGWIYLFFLCALQIVTGVHLQIETNLLKAICIQTKEFSLSQKVQLSLQNKYKYEATLKNADDACREVACTKQSGNKIWTQWFIFINGGNCRNVHKINCGSGSGSSSSSNIKMKEIIGDVQAHIRQVNVTDALCEGDMTWDAFYNLKDIYSFIDKLADVFPDNAQVITYGQSYEKRPLKLISISESHIASASAAEKKPIVFIECNIHAREWISAAMCTFLINELLVDKKECISTFLNDFDFYLIPVANPDGYFFSHIPTPATNRLWRKTRSLTSDSNCLGVDPNRNFNSHWMESDTSSDPCSLTYGGSKPNSEVEVESLQNYLLKPEISSRLKVYLPVHSAAQILLWPWSYALKNISDEHYQFFWETSQNAIEAMARRYGTQFRHRPSAQVFGPISGSSDDWTYEKILQYKTDRVYVATFELRNTPGNFVALGDEIIPSSLEAMDGICVIVQAVKRKSPGPVKPPIRKTTTTTKQPETKPPTYTEEPECYR